MPHLGERVGAGAMSEVLAWDEGRVVKLFLAAYDFAIERELACAQAVHQAGIASPAVHGVVDVDGRRGIVYERVDGPTLLDQLMRAQRSSGDVGRTLAAVHLAMHAVAVPGLQDLAAVIRARDPDAQVPAGDIVFHGDFHPGNVIASPAGPVTIDWVNAHLSTRAADVARTVMAVRYQALRAEQPEGALQRERAVRARILDSYLAGYLAAEPIAVEDLAEWLARAASSLHRSEPGSADAADLRALTRRRHDDLVEPVLGRLLAR